MKIKEKEKKKENTKPQIVNRNKNKVTHTHKALGKPRGSGWSGKWEGGSGWGTHVNPWLFHLNV